MNKTTSIIDIIVITFFLVLAVWFLVKDYPVTLGSVI